MPAPIRPRIHALVAFEKESQEFTLREATEWWKTVAKAIQADGTPTNMEVDLINKRWIILIKGIAEREGVPETLLSYMLGELALGEIQATDAAQMTLELTDGE